MSLDVLKARTARKLQALASQLLSQNAPSVSDLTRAATPEEYQALCGISEIGPQQFSNIWRDDIVIVCGLFGQFVLPHHMYLDLREAGYLTQSCQLTAACKTYLIDPDTYVFAREKGAS